MPAPPLSQRLCPGQPEDFRAGSALRGHGAPAPACLEENPEAQKLRGGASLGFLLAFFPALFLLPLQVQAGVTFQQP